MPGRHQERSTGRRGLRWTAGALGVALASGAAAVAMQTAHASPTPVTATFSVLGVSTSNCSVSTGGNDIYAGPGAPINFKTSVASINLLGLSVSTAGLTALDGTLLVDPGTTKQTKLSVTTTKATALTGLTTGNHPYKWTATALDVLGLPIPLSSSNTSLSGGASLTYTGTIHVTDQAALCGVAVQVPGVGVSASASGLPPVAVTLSPISPPTIPVPTLSSLPNVIPSVPVGSSTVPAAGGSGGTQGAGVGAECVPCEVVPNPDRFGGFGGAAPNAGSITQIGSALHDGPALRSAPTAPASSDGAQTTTTTKRIDLAANRAPAAQVPVLLAILAIIALSLVTATYARLYLLRRDV